jgi:uncharacterized membrane protein YccC
MSREERRAYQRQMKGMERGPALPPAAKARAERNATRRARRGATARPAEMGTRFWVRTVLVAVVIGFLVFSLQWGSGMPFALYAGLGAGLAVLLVLVAIGLLRRRSTSS